MIDVQKLAREAGFVVSDAFGPLVAGRPVGVNLEAFARLVLEEAAKVCDVVQRNHADRADVDRDVESQAYFEGAMVGAEDCADAIRSLKPKGEA